MNKLQRAKAIIVQLETLRDSERLNPDLRLLTSNDLVAAQNALADARAELPQPVSLDLKRRLTAIELWLNVGRHH